MTGIEVVRNTMDANTEHILKTYPNLKNDPGAVREIVEMFTCGMLEDHHMGFNNGWNLGMLCGAATTGVGITLVYILSKLIKRK